MQRNQLWRHQKQNRIVLIGMLVISIVTVTLLLTHVNKIWIYATIYIAVSANTLGVYLYIEWRSCYLCERTRLGKMVRVIILIDDKPARVVLCDLCRRGETPEAKRWEFDE